MNETEFLVWLKGFRDAVGEGNAPTPEQWKEVNLKLNECLVKAVKELFEKERFWREMQDAKINRTTPIWAGGVVTTSSGYAQTTTTPTYSMPQNTTGVVSIK